MHSSISHHNQLILQQLCHETQMVKEAVNFITPKLVEKRDIFDLE